MPTKTKLEISSFIKGLITEAGPLNFPSDASLVDQNFDLLKDGSRRRRKGLGFAKGFPTRSIPVAAGYVPTMSIHLWTTPSQTGDFDIVMTQVDNVLYFFKTKNGALEDNFLTSLTISTAAEFYTSPFKMNSTVVNGNLVVTFGAPHVLVLKWRGGFVPISEEYVRLQIRDIYGVALENSAGPYPYSLFQVDERPIFPSPLTPSDLGEIVHLYNLRNQGWPTSTTVVTNESGSTIATQDPIDLTLITLNMRPSMVDVIWRAKTSTASDPKAVGAFSPFELVKQVYGTTPAPKGKFVLDLFKRGESRQEIFDEYTGDPTLLIGDDESEGYVNLVASYAGRVFYTVRETAITSDNINKPNFATTIFFSKSVLKSEDVSKCHTVYDPASEYDFDVLDTDGGNIVIPEAGTIQAIVPLGSSLFVIASNGVWEISGGDAPFSATSQEVRKVSAIGGLSGTSVVSAESVISYWTTGGIYVISIDPSLNRGIATNITTGTIETHYLAIPDAQKSLAAGYYNHHKKTIRWLHNTDVNADPLGFDNEIIFDIDLKAFHTNTYFDSGTYPSFNIVGAVTTPSLEVLVVKRTSDILYEWGFCDYTDTTFRDFNTYDAKAILLTGGLTGSAGSLSKQVTKLVTHFNRTETGFIEVGPSLQFENPSGCLITTQWEWTNSAAAGKWGQPFEGYRLQRPYYPTGPSDPFDYSYTVVTSSHGLRGRGRAVSLKFESELGKDLHLLGWGIEVAVESQF